MRARLRLAASAGAALAAGASLVAGAGLVAGGAVASRPAVSAAAARTVGLAGYTADVPASWPVYDLHADPTRCVRFDQHAVYLGTPGPNQHCPAHAIGRTEALLVEPAGRGRDAAARAGSEPGLIRAALPAAGVVVTASYLRDSGLAASFVRRGGTGGRFGRTRGARPVAPLPTPHPAHGMPVPPGRLGARFPVPAALIRTGMGFDTCAAPSAATMWAWRPPTYTTVGIYVGGQNRSCDYGNLTPKWIMTVRGYGFSFLPTYVGLQAPCVTGNLARIDPGTAVAQGIAAAKDAAANMRRLGLGTGNPVYLDIEYYPRSASCTAAVLRYTTGWTQRLHALGYASGVYGNAGSVAADLAHATGTAARARPDALWFARWNARPDMDATPYVPPALWKHRRVHQYRGDHDEAHGGWLLSIDSNAVDGVVAQPARR